MLRKKKICKECGTPQYIFSHGKCRRCAATQYKAKQKSNRSAKYGGDTSLSIFFQAAIGALTGTCACCGKKYYPVSSIGPSVHVAHILPKSKFPEIATHPDNWFEACWEDHIAFDNHPRSLIEDRFGHFLPELRRKFSLFEHLILPEHRRHIPDFILQNDNTCTSS